MQYVMPFIVAMVVTMAGLPLFVRLAKSWLLVDQPGARKVHLTPVPRVGGLAMASGVIVAAIATLHLQASDRWLLLSAIVLMAFGALDDRFDLDYRIKLAGQLVAVAIVVFAGGIRIHSLTLDDSVPLPDWLALPLTLFFLVGITNAINLADGLDGLAGGTTFLCLCAVALLSSISESGQSTALALTFAGAVLGFLRFNTYPAVVFMGDAGSQMLGFVLGVLSIRATQNATSQISATIPILLLALPILDTLSVMAQRLGEGRSPFSPDKNHIHHKLLALGFQHHEAVTLIYVLQAVLFVVAYFMRFESDLLILAVVTVFFVASIGLLQVATRTGWRIHAKVSRRIDGPARMVPRLTYTALVVALASYAILVIVRTAGVSSDLRYLAIGLLVLLVALFAMRRSRPLILVEKGVLFSTATMLVFLETVAASGGVALWVLSWIAVAVAGLATAIRLRLMNDGRFRLTPLDVIVAFMALVVPSIPGVFRLPHAGALGIAKLVVLFYAIEMLISRADSRVVWLRIAGVALLAGLVLRSAG